MKKGIRLVYGLLFFVSNVNAIEGEFDAEDELDDFEAWPVLSVGLNYAF